MGVESRAKSCRLYRTAGDGDWVVGVEWGVGVCWTWSPERGALPYRAGDAYYIYVVDVGASNSKTELESVWGPTLERRYKV